MQFVQMCECNSVTVSVLSENTQLTSALEKARGEIRVRQPAELVPKSLYVRVPTHSRGLLPLIYTIPEPHFLSLFFALTTTDTSASERAVVSATDDIS